jgi:hypothetical protein
MCEHNIFELTHGGILRKQRSITNLFPDFGDKVKGVADKGGLRLTKLEPQVWKFQIHSGTKDSVWYDGWMRFKNTEEMLRKHVPNAQLWTKSKQHVNLLKLAKEVMFDTDIQLYCSCPAFKYWGADYILSLNKYDAKLGDPETRAPNKRNPKQYGSMCKHLQNVMNVLPWYNTNMATWLRDEHTPYIRQLEDSLKQVQQGVSKAADQLGQMQAAEPREEPREEQPENPEEDRRR